MFLILLCISIAFLVPFYPTVALVAWGLEAVYVLPRLGRAFLENSASAVAAAAGVTAAGGGAAPAAGGGGAGGVLPGLAANQGAAAAGQVAMPTAGAGGVANSVVPTQPAPPVHRDFSSFLKNFVSQQHVRYPRVYFTLSLLLPVVACFAHYDMNMNRLALDHKHVWPDILFWAVAALWTPLWYIN